MARTATPKSKTKAKKPARAKSGTARAKSSAGAADAVVNFLQSPLVAELVAVAATAAIASIAAAGSGKGKKRSGNAVKTAGLAAAAALGQRLKSEVTEIRKSAKAKQ